MKLKLMKAVYSYYYPDVRRLMNRAERRITPALYKLSTPVASLDRLAGIFNPPLELTQNDGNIDLDLLHEPVLSRVAKVYSTAVTGLDKYSYRYPTSGSSEALFHLIARLKTEGTQSIYVLKGEYEGFSAYASHLGIQAIEVDPLEDDFASFEPGVWIISTPSARDGNMLPALFVKELCDLGHRLILDFAYLGLTRPLTIDITHPNILAAVFSLSKPFGLFRFRIGYLFSRTEMTSLYANRWFKDIGRHLQGLHVLEHLGLETLYSRYRRIQCSIVEALRLRFQVPFTASDSLLIANLAFDSCPARYREEFQPYLRNRGYRFCLTPYFEEVEHQRRVHAGRRSPPLVADTINTWG